MPPWVLTNHPRMWRAVLLLCFIGCGAGHIDLFPDTVESGRLTDAAEGATDANATPDRSSDVFGLDQIPGDAATDTIADATASDQVADTMSRIIDSRTDQVSDVALDQSEAGQGGTCLSDTDCRASGLPRCQPLLQVCVQCVVDADCAGQSESKCDQATNTCTAPCKTDKDCAPPDVCDTSQGACADCLTDVNCAGTSQPRCMSHECVQCITAQDCTAPMQCWQQTCVACVTNADCPAGVVCSTSHECN
jgi:Cys-rich repeat protein